MATKGEIQQLISAVLSSDLEALNQLLEQNKDLIKLQTEDGETLLHLAAQLGNAGIVTALLKVNASLDNPIPDFINAQDTYGYTALNFAATYKHPEVVKLLIDNGAIDKPNIFQETAAYKSMGDANLEPLFNSSVLPKDLNVKTPAKHKRLQIGLLTGLGIITVAILGAGLSSLMLTLLGVTLLPLAALPTLIIASGLIAAGIISLGMFAFAAYRYNVNYASTTIESAKKASANEKPVPSSSLNQAATNLGVGSGNKPEGDVNILPLTPTAPVFTPASDDNHKPTTAPAPGAGLTKQS